MNAGRVRDHHHHHHHHHHCRRRRRRRQLHYHASQDYKMVDVVGTSMRISTTSLLAPCDLINAMTYSNSQS